VVSPTTIIILKVEEAIKIKILGGIKITVHPTTKVLSNNNNNPLYPSIPERLNKFEHTMEKFMKVIVANQENNMIAIRNIEI